MTTPTTPSNHTREEAAAYAKHANSQPRHSAPSTVTRHPAPNRSAPQDTTPNSPSAKFDKMQHNPTGCNENSCAHAREATAFRFLPLGMDLRPGGLDMPPTSFPHPPTSFPRRRESTLRPGGLDVSPGVPVPEPPCQQIERNPVLTSLEREDIVFPAWRMRVRDGVQSTRHQRAQKGESA